jgi:alpha-L-fucosidase
MNTYPRWLTSAFLSIAALSSAHAAETAPPKSAAPSTATAPAPAGKTMTSEERLAWFREAKFGLFIHWGLYSIPAGEWKGKRIEGIGEWIMQRAQIPAVEYAELAKQFNPKKFNADDFAKLAKDAGMKYLVLTAKHHDGFALFKSDVSPFNVVDATPFKRDIVKELSQACAKQGIRFGVYYSQAQDWHEKNGNGNTWDFGPEEKKDFDQYLRDKAEPQVRELMTKYGPICLIWFDTPRGMTKERGQRFADIVRSLQPACLIDGRLGSEGDYMSTGDNVIPETSTGGAWEVPATLNHTWGFKSYDHDWKSPGELTFKLVDIVSKGGNYLLNVGPTAEGVIPQPSQDNLRAVGEWLKVNGDAIYGAGPSPFGDEFGEYSTKIKDAKGKFVFNPRTDYRVTTQPGKLYLTIFMKWPREGGFLLPDFKNEIKRAYLNADPAKTPIEIEKSELGRTLKLGRGADTMAPVICLEIEGDKVQL